MQKKSTKSNAVMMTVVGASLAGLAATAYFFFGPKGKKHRQHSKAWVIKMKGDVVEKFETAREITEPLYHKIIDTVAKKYKKEKKASQPEIDALAADLKKHWKSMSKSALTSKRELTKDISKLAKKATLKKKSAQ